MKNIKKLLSIVMVLTLVLSLGASAFAAAPEGYEGKTVNVEITEKNGTVHGTYKAYKLLNATTTAGDTDGDEGYAYTVNDKYRDILKEVTGAETDEAIIKYISEQDSADEIRAFADNLYEKLGATEADATSAEGAFNNLTQGYYLIEEVGAVGGATSAVMLDTAGRQNIKITAKEDVPTVDKTVADQNDSKSDPETWGEVADWDIGDDVPFKLEATMPSKLTSYDTYSLTFHDVESAGLTFKGDSVVVKINGTEIKTGFEVVYPVEGDDGCTFEVVIADVLAAPFSAKEGDTITVEYKAELNTGAVIGGEGNPNTVSLEYSNNPYDEGTGKTKEDRVVVFTFTLDVNKVNGDTEPLDGAGFTLSKKMADGTWKQIGNEVMVTGSKDTEYVANFKGLDEGDYKIEETTVPPGFNKADDIEFSVVAEYQDANEADGVIDGEKDTKVKSLVVKDADGIEISGEGDDKTFKVNMTDGKIDTTVVNQTGVELPSTGGIGTTIFYAVGAILVVGAVILLVTRKRMSGAEK